MKTAEQVLAEVAALLAEAGLTVEYLPKPEPDRLTVAAEECVKICRFNNLDHIASKMIRAIIAREVAAAEPSDEAIDRAYEVIWRGGFPTTTSARAAIRAALKGEEAHERANAIGNLREPHLDRL